MLEKEILELFKCRYLNEKTNNYIFTGVDDYKILDKIPKCCGISLPENDINIDFAQNIIVDFNVVKVKDILNYVLDLLKKSLLLDGALDYKIDFNNKFDLLRFQEILYRYQKIVQLICYHVEDLSLDDQKLLNQLYYFNSIFYNINSFITGNNFKSYFLNDGKVLDSRENYTKIKILKI